MLKERILKILKDKNIPAYKMEEDLGLAKGYISKLDKTNPNSDKLRSIANYLETSVDYLLEIEQGYYYNPDTAKTAQELFDNPELRILFDAARDSKPEDLQMAADLLRRLKQTNPDG